MRFLDFFQKPYKPYLFNNPSFDRILDCQLLKVSFNDSELFVSFSYDSFFFTVDILHPYSLNFLSGNMLSKCNDSVSKWVPSTNIADLILFDLLRSLFLLYSVIRLRSFQAFRLDIDFSSVEQRFLDWFLDLFWNLLSSFRPWRLSSWLAWIFTNEQRRCTNFCPRLLSLSPFLLFLSRSRSIFFRSF